MSVENGSKSHQDPIGEDPTLLRPRGEVTGKPRARVSSGILIDAIDKAARWLRVKRRPDAPVMQTKVALRPETKSTLATLKEAGIDIPAVSIDEGAHGFSSLDMGANKYDLVNRLGVGGMGEVYLVYDRDLRRRAALKTVRDLEPRLFEPRFLKEAQVIGQLEHPNIVPVYELGLTESGRPYYTMPVVRGKSLEQILQGLVYEDPEVLKIYSLTRLMQVFLQLTLAVAYAHDKGVIHRDIKPSNVMLGEHGEVLLLDWGLAKVLQEGDVDAALVSDDKHKSQLAGTPSYMAPEQIAGKPVDARTDVYALGVVLYELLTWTPPFEGDTETVLRAHKVEVPPRPRVRSPERSVPLELETICVKALEKRPEDRHQSAKELHDEVQAWLEASADKVKRQERAGRLAARGEELLAIYRKSKEEIHSLEEELGELRGKYKGWQPFEEKTPLIEAEDRVEGARRNLVETASSLVMTLSGALGQDDQHPLARRLMADFYWDRFLEAEARGDLERHYFEKLVAAFHDGRYDQELKGDGALQVETDPEGAEVFLCPYVEKGFQLVPGTPEPLGKTPVDPVPLEMGSYLAIIKKEGYRDVHYPVWISRNRHWTAKVRMYSEAQIGAGFCHIPAGPFRQGGDEGVQGWSLPPSEAVLADFFIAEYPVTFRDYLVFLNDVALVDIEEAFRRSPRRGSAGGSFLQVGDSRKLELLPAEAEAQHWSLDAPVVNITWHDAAAYCVWRSEKEGCEVRLPTESEWEKASRGVDGRWYPWGNRFDPSLCNMRLSLRERAALLAIDSFPSDVSVYGVRGTAGNVRDWTATAVAGDDGIGGEGESRVIRGGAWNLPAVICRSANRFWLAPTFLSGYVGFRLVRSNTLE